MGKNLNNIVSGTATKWKDRAKSDRENRKAISRAQLFALELMDYMDSVNLKQKDLAEKMGVSPQQINKILRAKSNLTFETLDKIEEALGVTITPPRIKVKSKSYSAPIYSMQIVHKSRLKEIEENLSSKTVIAKNPLLETDLEKMDEYKYTATQI